MQTTKSDAGAAAVTIDDLVRARLDEKGWTREVLAKKVRLSTSGLRKLCRGHVQDARGPTVQALARALGKKASVVRAAIEQERLVAHG